MDTQTYYEVTNPDGTVAIIMETMPGEDTRRPFVDIVREGHEANRETFTTRQAAFAAMGEWIHRYGNSFAADSNLHDLRVYEIRTETIREEVA